MSGAPKKACVVVLGDFGRSPRMQYHTLSLAKQGYSVDVVAYGGSPPLSDVVFNPQVTLRFMTQPPNFASVLSRLLAYILKVLWQSWFLMVNLLWISKPAFLLVQNPPSIPTIPVCWLVCRIRGIKLIVDWHNYGYSILALPLGPKHTLVRLSHFIERNFGKRSDINFCVSQAMGKDLKENWGIEAITVYDRPAEMFKPVDLAEKHELFLKLGKVYPQFKSTRPDGTLLTERFADGVVRLREDRPGLIVSSTSWTEDEDFSILLDALDEYELNRSSNDSDYPPLVCVITGKGPLKSYYQALIDAKRWQHVVVCTPWLDAEDYPKLIASADLGVCLHTSSSGLDLPMKVIDMLGCCLPVCAIEYQCLKELIRPGENGLVFKTSGDLADQLLSWFCGFPNENQCRRQVFNDHLNAFQEVRWHSSWTQVVLPNLPQ